MGRYSRVSFLIVGLLIFPAVLFAQFNNNTSSPYSRYGLGDLHSYSFGRTTAMGGASLASRNNLQINSSNPASYTAIDSLNFLFEFGLQGNFSTYKTNESKLKTNDINFNYFSMAFRITDWMATSIGLQPYSDVGYQVLVNDTHENIGDFQNNYYGTGTISKAYIGVAVEPVKNISVGMNVNYLFGNLSRNSELAFAGAGFYAVQRYSTLRMRDFSVDFGLQATLPLKDNKELIFAAVFANQPEYTTLYSDIILKNTYYGTSYDQDTLFHQEETKSSIQFPYTLGGGISFRKKDVYEINFDYFHQNWSQSTFFGEESTFLTDLNKFAIGAEWIPDKYSIRSALNRIAYRAGFRYEQTYHSFDGYQINDFGISFGVGVPLYHSASTINIGAEIGRRGTKDNNLVLQNYAKVNLSVNLHDLWFMQRKID
ncbi:hypothetical protein OU798_13035 [Prolixibacteraceae bacterium Z1-6]|uniref:Outer membrane protein transport protein (OMPP1/FadL/TodX) n=1 Tax=Draconibacterium aestuarii TaxID=2998507 RepID=A0A9X3J785_9BACT|nr:hypothetical protein [Prolixibacteraceae bacterium Z1-6]